MEYIANVSGSLEGFPASVVIFLILFLVVALLCTPLCLGLILSASLRKRTEQYMQSRDRTVIAQYEPPLQLSPAEIGFLYDMRCDAKEIRATLFALQQRNIIVIDSKSAVTVTNPSAFDELQEYEKVAIRMFNKSASSLEPVKSLPITIFSSDGTQTINLPLPPAKSKYHFTSAVQASLAAKGYKTRNYYATFWSRVLVVSVLVGLWPMLFAAVPLDSNGVTYSAWSIQSIGSAAVFTAIIGMFVFPLYLLFGYILMRLYVKIAGQVWLNTKQIRKLWPALEGYRLFLEQVDLDNIQFESANAQASALTTSLPYAIVFNLDTKWEQRFQRAN